tara:strand:+ start:275 stop:421 length:147 start_codon:yes stop_codon:yes gene_type:complete
VKNSADHLQNKQKFEKKRTLLKENKSNNIAWAKANILSIKVMHKNLSM